MMHSDNKSAKDKAGRKAAVRLHLRMLAVTLALLLVICEIPFMYTEKAIAADDIAAEESTTVDNTAAENAAGELTGLSAMEIVAQMGKGFNIGNSFDANGGVSTNIYSQETSWGNSQVSPELMHGIAEAGFKTVRIPITWYRHVSDDGTYTVTPEWMARIKEVVGYAYDEGLFVIINLHHEPWINKATLADDRELVGQELTAIWAQIADAFADYDQHLIFEAMNEPRAAGTNYEWTGTKKEYDAVNYLNQLFAETIRTDAKGNNGERALMIPGYAASSSASILNSIVIPTIDGEQLNNVIISVHCYDPYNFCLSDEQVSFNPKNSSDTAGITNLISNLKNRFISKGIPAVIGECGCTNTKNNNDSRAAWFRFMGTKTEEAGIPAIVWDNGAGGTSGGECHRYINRKTGENMAPTLTDAFIYGTEPETEGGSSLIDLEPYKIDGVNTAVVIKEVGFTNPKLSLQPRVNHTEGAAIGYSVKYDPSISGDNLFFDLSSYKGNEVTITVWVNASDDRITIGVTDDREADLPHGESEFTDTTVTRHSAPVAGDWVRLSYTGKLPNKKGIYLYFHSEKGTTFNIDDLSVVLGAPADPARFVSDARMVSEGLNPADIDKTAEGTTDQTGTTAAGSATASDGSSAPAGSADHTILYVILALVILAGILIPVLILRSKKKS